MAAHGSGAEATPQAAGNMEAVRLLDEEAGGRAPLSPKARMSRAHSHTSPKEVSQCCMPHNERMLSSAMPRRQFLQALIGMLSSWLSRRFFSGWCVSPTFAP